MRVPSSFLSALVVIAAMAASPVVAQSAHDAHAAHAPAATPAQRWTTDASLRDGMRRIRDAVDALQHYEHGHMDALQAANTAATIEGAVNALIAGCKLKPDADAALHGLLVEFLAGAKAVRASQEAPVDEIARMRDALARYPQLFDDAAWSAAAN